MVFFELPKINPEEKLLGKDDDPEQGD